MPENLIFFKSVKIYKKMKLHKHSKNNKKPVIQQVLN